MVEPPSNLAGFDPTANAGDCRWNPRAASDALDFKREMLKHVKGPLTGQPFIEEPWQRNLTATLHGWRRPDGTRRFRHCYCEVPRKNGKTTWLATEVVYALFCDPQSKEGAELYSAACTREQAALVYGQVCSMIRRNPLLSTRAKISNSVRQVTRILNGVVSNTAYRALPAKESQAHGFSPTFIAADELHKWPGREFYDALQTGTGARRQPLSIDITTAGFDRESICWLQHEYSQRVAAGLIEDDAFLPVIYGAPDDADWTQPDTWRDANPNLGVSLSWEYLQRECRRAQETKSYENAFRRLHLNQWTQQVTRYLQMDSWDKARASYTEDELVGRPCYGGLDLGATQDLTALVLIFRDADGRMQLLPRFWIPEQCARRIEKSDRVPYHLWARQGHLTITPGSRIDRGWVIHDIREDATKFDVRAIGYDPWQAEEVWRALHEHGIMTIKVPQNLPTLNAPTKELERALVAGDLLHPGNPCLSWQASNVEVKTDANGNVRPVKPATYQHRLRIDGIVAAIIALSIAMNQEPEPESAADLFEMVDR